MTEHKIEYYDNGRIKSVDGIEIASDKHAYVCKECGAIYQSKNIQCRSIFSTNHPKCDTCNHAADSLIRVCECEPVITS